MQSEIVLYRDTIAICTKNDNSRLRTAHNVLRCPRVLHKWCLNEIKKTSGRHHDPLMVPAHIDLICRTCSKANGKRSHGSIHGTSTVIVRRRGGVEKSGPSEKAQSFSPVSSLAKMRKTWRAGYPATLTNNNLRRHLSPFSSFVHTLRSPFLRKGSLALKRTKHKRFARYVLFQVFLPTSGDCIIRSQNFCTDLVLKRSILFLSLREKM